MPFGIHLVRVQTFRLDEHLVRTLVGEAMHLVLDRGTVARADPFDRTGEHRRAVEGGTDDVVGALVGMGDVAGQLARMLAGTTEEREHRQRRITVLNGERTVVDAAAIDARRRTGLQATAARRDLAQLLRQAQRRRIAGAPGGVVVETDMDAAGEEGADREHHAGGFEHNTGQCHDAAYAAALDHEIRGLLLEQRQPGLILEQPAYRPSVEHTVGLRARGTHRRPFAGIEGAKLDAGHISGARHCTAERIDLAYQVALADAADRRVAAHGPQRLDALRQQQRRRAHARSRERSLGAGVAAADDNDIE